MSAGGARSLSRVSDDPERGPASAVDQKGSAGAASKTRNGGRETIKYTDRPYFVLEGNICALLAAKDHVNVFLYDGAIVPDPEGIITGGHENETRTVAVREGETVSAPALTAMFKQIIANNRAGGWRRLKRQA